MGDLAFLTELSRILKDRMTNPPENSYAGRLLQEGVDRILRKIGEESGEVIIAAKNQNRDELLNESADLIFHLMLLLTASGVSLSDVAKILAERHQQKS